MKGIVFTEFLEMVEGRFSPDVVDRIIEEADLPNGGAYTSVGTYDYQELIRLVVRLGAAVGAPVPDLVRAFGRHLFRRFVALYPDFFAGVTSSFDFLSNVESVVHVEVLKLYPDAELPRFDCQATAEGMTLTYTSRRPFADLAEGLILGCAEHFGEPIAVARQDDPAGRVQFALTRCAPEGRS